MRFQVFSGLAACLLVASKVAWAGGAFGGAGQLAISDDQPIGAVVSSGLVPLPASSNSAVSFEYGSVSDNGGSGTAFTLSPAVDYFVIRGLSIGADFLVGVYNPAHANSGSGGTITAFGIAPRVGYNLPLSEIVSFWPKVYFEYVTINTSSGNLSGGGSESAIGLFAPFMFEPAQHFLFGIGPNLSTQLGNSSSVGNNSVDNPKVTLLGVQATLGGWFLGD